MGSCSQGNHTLCTDQGGPCPRWLWHNGTGIVLTGAVGNATRGLLEVNVTNRTGNFAALTAHATPTPALSRTLETYSVRMLHGVVTATAAGSFGYDLIPSTPVEAMVEAMVDSIRNLYVQNTPSVHAASACGGRVFGPEQLQAVFWPTPSGGAPTATVDVSECILGAKTTMSASLPSIGKVTSNR